MMKQDILRWLRLALVPYAIYPVAYVFESRLPFKDIPVVRGQSKAFLPGDATLALFIALAGKFDYPPVLKSRILGLLVGLAALLVVRRLTYKPEDYTPQQWKSPSKVYHDVVVCVFFGYLIVTRCIPFYVQTNWDDRIVRKLLGLSGLGVWIAGVVWDELHDEVPNNRQHPTRYWPIWDKPTPGPLAW